MDFLRVLITAPISIIVLFLLCKLIGNKQMSSLNLFDYINSITIGSIAAEMVMNDVAEFWEGIIALVIYSGIVILFSVLSQKFLPMRRFFTGKSILLYDRGKIYNKNLATAKLDLNELLSMCRTKGYFFLDEIETMFLEQSGDLSILPKDKFRPATPEDFKIRVRQSRADITVIEQGKILHENLKHSGNNEEWLTAQLKAMNKKAQDVFLAVCDGDNNLKVFEASHKNYANDIFG